MPKIHSPLPNPNRDNDPDWSLFEKYLTVNNITQTNHPAIDAYQNASSPPYLAADELNHCLTLRYFGTTSMYADLACDRYGDGEDHWEPKTSLDELDKLFSDSSYQFTPESVLFKGIGSAPFYKVLDLPNQIEGDCITFPGFLSTSVCREKAESFASAQDRILLVITGLEYVNGIVPPNRCVSNSPTPTIPEQEILLNRGLSFTVVCNTPSHQGLRVIEIKANS